MFYHFEYTSGANPYIAKTEKERDRIIRKYGAVKEISKGFYLIDDRRQNDIPYKLQNERSGPR